MTTARQHKTGPAQTRQSALAREFAAGPPGRKEEAAHRSAKAGPDPAHAEVRRADRVARRADEHAQAARSGVPCGQSDDHLLCYLRAEQSGAITRKSLKDVIAGLDVIAPHVLIQPPGSGPPTPLAPRQPIRSSARGWMRLKAPTASKPRLSLSSEGGSITPPGFPQAFYRGYDEVAATYARQARELEAGT